MNHHTKRKTLKKGMLRMMRTQHRERPYTFETPLGIIYQSEKR